MIAESVSDLPLKRWTVEDYHRMITTGILTPEDQVELLEGQIVEMVPQEPPHAATTDEGADYLRELFREQAKVRSQLPITLAPDSEPEPDIAIVRIDPNRYRDRHPESEDIFLVIEISDTTLSRDRNRKAKIYAQAKINEYWIVNLNQRQVIVYRHPEDGLYQVKQTLGVADSVTPLVFPDLQVQLTHLLL